MNRAMLILVGLLVIAGIGFYIIGSRAQAEEAGPFADYDTCGSLLDAFEAHPNATTLGDEYRARFRQLDC